MLLIYLCQCYHIKVCKLESRKSPYIICWFVSIYSIYSTHGALYGDVLSRPSEPRQWAFYLVVPSAPVSDIDVSTITEKKPLKVVAIFTLIFYFNFGLKKCAYCDYIWLLTSPNDLPMFYKLWGKVFFDIFLLYCMKVFDLITLLVYLYNAEEIVPIYSNFYSIKSKKRMLVNVYKPNKLIRLIVKWYMSIKTCHFYTMLLIPMWTELSFSVHNTS